MPLVEVQKALSRTRDVCLKDVVVVVVVLRLNMSVSVITGERN